MAEPLRTIRANVGGALNLVGLLKQGGQIAYTSTSEVYGDPLVSPQPESYRGYVDCTGPRSSYDESKRCVESLLFEARRVHGVRVKVVRLFNVFGPRTRVDDGRAVSNFITQGLRGLPITVYGDGTHTRSWTYIDDALDALERFFWRDRSEFAGPVNRSTKDVHYGCFKGVLCEQVLSCKCRPQHNSQRKEVCAVINCFPLKLLWG